MTIVTGIDIGSKTTRVVICDASAKGLPQVLGHGTAESRGLRRGYIVNTDETTRSVREAIERAERMANIKVREAFVSVSGVGLEGTVTTGAAIITRADSIIGEQDVQRVILASERALPQPANKRIIHTSPITFSIDGKQVYGNPAGMKGLKLETRSLVITCLEPHLDNLVRSVEEADIAFLDATAAPLAASYVALTKAERMAGCALVNIGAETTSIVVSEDGFPISLEVFPMGSTDITNDIAIALQISLDEAESIKIGASATKYPKRLLSDAITGRLGNIFDLLASHLKKIGRNGLLPAGIVFSGGGAELPGLAEFARDALHLPTKIVSSLPETFPISGNKREFSPTSWFVAYGLCVFGASGGLGDRHIDTGRWGRMKRAAAEIIKQFLP